MITLFERKRIIKYVIALLILVVFFVGIPGLFNKESYPKIDFSEGWKIISTNESREGANLREESLNLLKKGDEVTLINHIDQKIDNPALLFMTYHSSVQVFVDRQLIYENGTKEDNKGLVVGCGYHIVSLPSDYTTRIISIRITATEDEPFEKIGNMEIIDSQEYMYGFISENAFGVVTTFFLMMVGIIATIGSLIAGIDSKDVRKILYTGVMSFLIGLWAQCYYGYFMLICHNQIINYYCEHLSLFCLIIPLLLFYIESIKEGKLKRVLKGLLFANILFLLIGLILHFLNIIHLNKFVVIFHMLVVIAIIPLLVAIFSDNIKNKKARLSMRIGIIGLSIALVLELVKYNIVTIFHSNFEIKYVISIGGMIYVVSSIIANLFTLIEKLEESVKEEALIRMAYGDSLTGLTNRKCCEDKMTYIDQNNIKSFAIINFDLNWLKKINDGIGHVKGDEYLCEFSTLLKDCCAGKATVGRMGGDEFIAIFEDVDEKYIQNVIRDMNKRSGNGNMPETREIGSGISFAYGYAVSSPDRPMTTSKAFEIADEKMYECKRKQKVGRQ